MFHDIYGYKAPFSCYRDCSYIRAADVVMIQKFPDSEYTKLLLGIDNNDSDKKVHEDSKLIPIKQKKRYIPPSFEENRDDIEIAKNAIAKRINEIRLITVKIQPHILVTDILERIKYTPFVLADKGHSKHYGQRKLALAEIQFLTKHTSPLHNNTYVIYAGAAPSIKGAYVASLFPHIKFIFIDPAKFAIKPVSGIIVRRELELHMLTRSRYNICTYQRCMTTGFAKQLKDALYCGTGDREVLFISDIRTCFGARNEDEDFIRMHEELSELNIDHDEHKKTVNTSISPPDINILWNLAQQMVWIAALEPKMSSLKFRPPFYGDDSVYRHADGEDILPSEARNDFDDAKMLGIDFIQNYIDKKMQYLNGDVYLQAWSRPSSTESRMVTDGKHISDYSIDRHEDAFFAFNNTWRSKFNGFVNPYADTRMNFTWSFDCALESNIWHNYMRIHDNSKEIPEKRIISLLKQLNMVTGWKL